MPGYLESLKHCRVKFAHHYEQLLKGLYKLRIKTDFVLKLGKYYEVSKALGASKKSKRLFEAILYHILQLEDCTIANHKLLELFSLAHTFQPRNCLEIIEASMAEQQCSSSSMFCFQMYSGFLLGERGHEEEVLTKSEQLLHDCQSKLSPSSIYTG